MPRGPPTVARIAFTSNRDGNEEIYVMNADGSGVTRLTNNSANDGGADWSPDGTRVVFASDRDGNYEIYVMYVPASSSTAASQAELPHPVRKEHQLKTTPRTMVIGQVRAVLREPPH